MHLLESYLRSLSYIYTSGAGVAETSYYPPLANLLDEVGQTLKPKVRCILNLKNIGAGLPDGGLFTADQFPKTPPTAPTSEVLKTLEVSPKALPPNPPTRGAVEVKSADADVYKIAQGLQVVKYLAKYRQVLTTNYREFVLMGLDSENRPVALERYSLASTAADFWAQAAQPHQMVEQHGDRLVDFLKRVMLRPAPLADPEAVAWFLASYAREAHYRLEQEDLTEDLPGLAPPESPLQMALNNIRDALEDALGLTFEGEKGDRFFRSTLVQTLFYGIFSAWVLWHNEQPARQDRFDWRLSHWYLRVPMIQTLFGQLAQPNAVGAQGLNLEEVLNWAGDALNRVERAEFFSRFEVGRAIQYFYEPFLQAFSPELRKELGVWYTPPEIVQYMVARVDMALRTELGLADGLADEQVYVLDPCCGTGAYLVEVLRRIAATHREQGADALSGYQVNKAAIERVFGFEILPAPFVIAHLQLGLLLQSLGAPLAASERAGVFLTNALTGWTPSESPKQHLLFPALEAERDAADAVKQNRKILVVLGNPPYNGFAGLAVAEERDLTDAYRTTQQAPTPQGQGLNDLYVRFFRLAERQIVERSGKGVVCFISNYSWLDGLSFTGMRERYLAVFGKIWIDNLHGDRIVSEYAPDGRTSETVFAMPGTLPGIKVGTAISLLVRKGGELDILKYKRPPAKTRRSKPPQTLRETPFQPLYRDVEDGESVDTALPEQMSDAGQIHYRDMDQARATERREALIDSLSQANYDETYQPLQPDLRLGLPLKPQAVIAEYLTWPLLPELFPTSFPGIQPSRDDVVMDIDRDRLVRRMEQYFNPNISHEAMQRIAPQAMHPTQRFDPISVRDYLRQRGFLPQNIVRYCYRPFDLRWLYWEPETKLLDEKRAEYFPQVREGNLWLAAAQKNRRAFDPPIVTTRHCSRHVVERGANLFPLRLKIDAQGTLFAELSGQDPLQLNLSKQAARYLADLGANGEVEALFYHLIAILYAPEYREENTGVLRQDWPRVPLPNNLKLLQRSAALGRTVAALLDPEQVVPDVTSGQIRPELKTLGIISRVRSPDLSPDSAPGQLDPHTDLAITVGWGYAGQGGVTMPGQGRLVEREFTPDERTAIEKGAAALGLSLDELARCLGNVTLDVYLNDVAYWANVPLKVWEYTIGGYQVIKKWLSYREERILGRPLKLEEAHEVTRMVRRLAAIVLLEPALDANYRAVKQATYEG